MAKQGLVLPVPLAKQENPRSHLKLLQRVVVLGIIIGVLVVLEWVMMGRPRGLRGIVDVPLFVLVASAIYLYLPGYLSYELRENGIFLRSALRRRHIAYDEISCAAVFTDLSSLGFGWWAIGTPDYEVGLYSHELYGWVDVVASHLHDPAVILLLKNKRPVIFTPEDPERVVEMIESIVH
ncbi:MAG: hypothetical protein KGZ50_09830 [Peptococcaceae bacterium]|nr:hypothetical protein [Peptococcaceae bacterium]